MNRFTHSLYRRKSLCHTKSYVSPRQPFIYIFSYRMCGERYIWPGHPFGVGGIRTYGSDLHVSHTHGRKPPAGDAQVARVGVAHRVGPAGGAAPQMISSMTPIILASFASKYIGPSRVSFFHSRNDNFVVLARSFQ